MQIRTLPEISPGIHTASTCMWPLPSGSSQNWGPHGSKSVTGQGINTKQQRKSSLVGQCRTNSGRKHQKKGFLQEVPQRLVCQRPDYTCLFSLACMYKMGSCVSFLHKCQSPQTDYAPWGRGPGLFLQFSLHVSHRVSP